MQTLNNNGVYKKVTTTRKFHMQFKKPHRIAKNEEYLREQLFTVTPSPSSTVLSPKL